MSLLQWARWYKSLFEMNPKDKPSDDLIENDFELDRWFDNYLRDAARAQGRRLGGSVKVTDKNSLPVWSPDSQ